MRSILFSLLITFIFFNVGFGQISVPYFNSFDSPADETGWTHYAITGTDDWEMGQPSGQYLNAAFSNPGAWVTNLDGPYQGYSSRVLVTPAFDFTNLPANFSLSFYQKRHSASTANYYLEYSINGGSTWSLLNPATTLKKNWQTASGFANGTSNNFFNSAISLASLQGQASVMFRFRFVSNYVNGDGWLIDDFSINQEYYNIYGLPGDTINSSPKCGDFTVTTTVGFSNAYSQSINNTTKYYFSYDPVLDGGDVLLGTRVGNISNSVSWDKTFTMLPNLDAGNYYIIYQHDALNVLTENIETDNVGVALLHLDSVYELPFNDNFEIDNDSWTAYLNSWGVELYWESNSGISHHLEGAHSGVKSWNTSKSVHTSVYNCGNNCNIQYLESPYFNLSSGTTQKVLSFWYKNAGYNSLEYSPDCGETWTELYFFSGSGPNDDWSFMYFNLDASVLSDATKFRFKFQDSYEQPEGISIDDFYVGPDRPDHSIEFDKQNRFTASEEATHELKFHFTNSGLNCSESEVHFYWSTDSILDGSDLLVNTLELGPLGVTFSEWMTVQYTKPTTIPGTYYILYQLDAQNEIVEMREYNNMGYFTLYQYNDVSIPYTSDFESNVDNWRHNASLGTDSWDWVVPDGEILDTAFSGTKAWVTHSPDIYLDSFSRMHLYTPVFNFTNTNHPVMFFDMKLDGDGGCNCFDANMNMSYSIDGGANWQILDVTNQSYNRWYYPQVENGWGTDEDYYLPNTSEKMFAPVERSFATYWQYNSKDVERNTRYVIDLIALAGVPHIQFRYNLVTNHNENVDPINDHPREGAIIDNFVIEEVFTDLTVNYKKAIMNSSAVDSLKFFMNIKNQGIGINEPTTVNYYLSADTTLNAGDYLLGNAAIKPVQPDKADYINKFFFKPQNIHDYKYLIYEIDPDQLLAESNEINNVGYWLLALDSIHEYPYFNNFNDSIIDGWYQYSKGPYADTISDLRFRHMLAPSEYEYFSYKNSGEWFTDRSTFGNTYTAPKFYLQTPAFSFEHVDSVKLSFDLFCAGGSIPQGISGGQMQFSTDGGTNFTILTSQYGENHNWYNFSPSIWWFSDIYSDTAILDSTYFDLTFLRGEKNVVLQYTFNANETQANVPHGMRMDNFLIEGITLDYIALDSMVDISANLSASTIDIDYSISNIGDKDGRESETKFYWSADNIWDTTDILLDSVAHLPFGMNTTFNGQITLTYPTPILSQEYYVFYVADSENNVKEVNELNNIGSYKILFDAFVNYHPTVYLDSLTILDNESSVTIDYEIENSGFLDGGDYTTTFYWSLDDVLDSGDELLDTQSDAGINGQNTISASVVLDCPLPFIQDAYYVLYLVDEDSVVLEANETDNFAKRKVLIQSTASVTNENQSFQFIGVNGNVVFINSSLGNLSNSHLKLTNMLGQEVINREITLQNGLNEIDLPDNLVFGMYMLYLEVNNQNFGWKIVSGAD
jgi:hypothetical protein